MGKYFTRNPLVMTDFCQPSYLPTNERLKMLTFLLVDLKTSMRGQNGVDFYQESTGHVGFFLALALDEIANERLNFARNPMIMNLQRQIVIHAKTQDNSETLHIKGPLQTNLSAHANFYNSISPPLGTQIIRIFSRK